MVFNIINSSDVHPGDHLYRYRWFEVQQGIAVRYSKLAPIFVITSYKNTLRLMTLDEFKGRSYLRRVSYKQNNNGTQKTKGSCNRPPEEIVQNAFLLLDWIKTSPDRVRSLFENDLSQFARQCCTTVHEQWHNLVHPTRELTSTRKQFFDEKQLSRSSNAFNVALMCGMPFRQASHIGKEDFWTEKQDDNHLSQNGNDSIDQVSASLENTADEIMTFSPALIDLSSDDDVSLI